MPKDDAYLLDMLLASRKVASFLGGVDRAGFERDEIPQHAVMRILTIIGEAATRVSAEVRAAHPEVPWRGLVGMRNRLVHAYLSIDLAMAWETTQQDIPAPIALIEPVVPPEVG